MLEDKWIQAEAEHPILTSTALFDVVEELPSDSNMEEEDEEQDVLQGDAGIEEVSDSCLSVSVDRSALDNIPDDKFTPHTLYVMDD